MILARRAAVVALAACLSLSLVPAATAGPSIDAYRGSGVWIDVFDGEWNNPRAAVRTMHARGVRTLYLQTSNSSRPSAIHRPRATSAFIDAAHARNMRVVAWYLPTLVNVARDRARVEAALRFRTARGHAFDSFALDIESSAVRLVSRRNARLLRLSRHARKVAGPGRALGAVIPSPRGMQMHPRFWPRFPYHQLAGLYDVFVPMVYSSYHVDGAAAAYTDTATSLDILRAATSTRPRPIHLIAGVADRLDGGESRAVIRAAREYGLLGASMYDMATMGREDWAALAAMPANPVQEAAMPFALGSPGAFGNLPGTDLTHPAEVAYRLPPARGDLTLQYELYGPGAPQLTASVDGKQVAVLEPGPPAAWSGQRLLKIPKDAMSANRRSVLLVSTNRLGSPWDQWAIRGVSAVAAG